MTKFELAEMLGLKYQGTAYHGGKDCYVYSHYGKEINISFCDNTKDTADERAAEIIMSIVRNSLFGLGK